VAEVFIANVILSDVMYANLYLEGNDDLEQSRGSEVDDRRLHTLKESVSISSWVSRQTASTEGDLQQSETGPEVEPEPEPERLMRSMGLSRQASPINDHEAYIQVLKKAGVNFDTRKLLQDGGLGSLNLLRAASREDVVGCGLDTAQAATLFVALAKVDAGLDKDRSLSTRPNIDSADATEDHPSHRPKRMVLLLGLGPLVVFACALALSLQVLRYIDAAPLAFINHLRSDNLHGAIGPPHGEWSQADNGHPCPWEPQP
jgi:hypothetical protein